MTSIDDRVQDLGLTLPPPATLPPGVVLPFAFVHVIGNRAIISGHGPQGPDGSLAMFGRLGQDLDVEAGYRAARFVGLSILGSLQRELGALARITGWVKALGMVQSTPEFGDHPAVINGFSDLILEVFGPRVGAHARSAVGMASLPWNIPVEIEAEVTIA